MQRDAISVHFQPPASLIDILELFIFYALLASPKERPKLRVIVVAKATYWVIFCNFPGGFAIDGEVHIKMLYAARKHLQTQKVYFSGEEAFCRSEECPINSV